MKRPKDIEKLVKHTDIDTNAKMDQLVLDDALNALDRYKKSRLAAKQPSIWRIVAKTRLSRAAVATAAVLMVITAIWIAQRKPVEDVGQVRNLYGIVLLKNEDPPEKVTEAADIHPGQWIETLSGSKAEILLKDKSRLLPHPRTVLQINDKDSGPRIRLQQGFLAIEAAKQPLGKSLRVEAASSQIRILGTSLDVRLVKKRNGTKQTWVNVTSGTVELESAGKKVVLWPNMQGIADEGGTPIRRSSISEVNEMIRLFDKNRQLAAELHSEAGLPAIIDYRGGSSAAVWTIVNGERLRKVAPGQYSLRLRYRASGARLFTLEGAELPVREQGKILQIDFSNLRLRPEQISELILHLPEIKGLFQTKDDDNTVQFDRPANPQPVISLFQFRLPELELGNIEQAHPEPIETARRRNKLLITIAADAEMLEVCE